MIACASCAADNDPGHRFCMQCGAVLAAQPACRACGHDLPASARFCTSCGTAVAGEPDVPAGPGYVVDGEWHRAPGELVRRVTADEMRGAFARLLPGVDLDAFFRGSLVGKVLERLSARTVRIPAGSLGVVMVDGVCKKVLPPGEQTTLDWLKGLGALLQGDLAGAASAVADRLLKTDRIALYLVDRRPVPIRFTVEVPLDGALTTVAVEALASVRPTPDALGTFIDQVVGDRDSLASEDLYVQLRAEIERAATDALRSSRSLPDAEKAAERSLQARFSARTGLSLELVLAPRKTVHRMDLVLGQTEATTATCPSCQGEVRGGQRFCVACGAAQPVGEAAGGLFTADGVAVQLDLVLSVQGEARPTPPRDLLTGAAARHLRERDWADLVGADGFDALEQALTSAVADAYAALGLRVLAVDLVDARSTTGEWELGARAEMERAKREITVGREWLDVQGDALELEQLAGAVALRQEQVARDQAFERRRAHLDDARRQADLADGERELARKQAAAAHDDQLTDARHRYERQLADAAHGEALTRRRHQLDSELRRQQAEDESHADRLRREARLAELAGMSEIDAKLAEAEHRHELERLARLEGKSEAQILAMQASRLAEREHGAAFAEALGKLADGQAARAERERADARLDAKDARVMALMEKVVGASSDKDAAVHGAYRDATAATTDMAKTAVESHARVVSAAPRRACRHCDAPLPGEAKFCGACGQGQ